MDKEAVQKIAEQETPEQKVPEYKVTDVTVKKQIFIQLGVPFFVLAGFTLGVLIFGTLYFALKLGEESSPQSPSYIASSMDAIVESFTGQIRPDIILARSSVRASTIDKAAEEKLRTILASNSTLLIFSFFDSDGRQFYELHKARTPDSLKSSILNSQGYPNFLQQDVDEYLLLARSISPEDTSFIHWLMPLLDEDGEFNGTLVAGVSVSDIQNIMESFGRISPVRIAIIDRAAGNTLLSHSTFTDQRVGDALSASDTLTIFEGRKHGYGYIGTNDRRIDGVWEEISGTNWNITAETYASSYGGETRNVFIGGVVLLLVFVVLLFFYLHILNQKLIIPLRHIEKIMHYFRSGDYSEPIKVATENEFAAIAEILNIMAKNIEENTSARVGHLKKALDRQNTDTRLLIEKDVELREQGEKLKELDRAKSMFVSVAAHQMRTPLAAIRWAIKIVMDGDLGPVNPEQKEYLQKGYDSNARMIDLINDLLDVDKIESDKFSYTFTPVQLEKIIESILDELTPIAKDKGIELVFNKPTAEVKPINADEVKLRNALQNLIDNAIKYTIDGGDVIIKFVEESERINLAISDSGIGIPRSEQSKVFGKFFRAKNAISENTDGSGLGLFIVKKIIEKHGGEITFESREGKGTTFFITIPTINS